MIDRKVQYDAWISDYLTRHEGMVLGHCVAATAAMTSAFAELVIVRGHVHCPWGVRGHVWCAAPDGSIVDPTRAQFPQPISYDPWEPGKEVEIGVCMECAAAVWRAVDSLDHDAGFSVTPFCSMACARACAAALTRGSTGPFP